MSNELNHVVICGYDGGSRMLLDSLIDEIDFDTTTVSLIGRCERPVEVPPQFEWVEGDPTKESELEKVRLNQAAAVIIVGRRSDRPQIADATTILTVFTIRRYMAESPPKHPRRKPLYVVAEILESENVDHARTAGSDEVIESTRLGFSVLAHAISMPGTAHVMGAFASAKDNSLYIGKIPSQTEFPTTFGELSTRFRSEDRVLLIGFRRVGESVERLNPTEDTPIFPGDHLIYLANSPVLAPV